MPQPRGSSSRNSILLPTFTQPEAAGAPPDPRYSALPFIPCLASSVVQPTCAGAGDAAGIAASCETQTDRETLANMRSYPHTYAFSFSVLISSELRKPI